MTHWFLFLTVFKFPESIGTKISFFRNKITKTHLSIIILTEINKRIHQNSSEFTISANPEIPPPPLFSLKIFNQHFVFGKDI